MITHLHMAPTDSDIPEKMKEQYDDFYKYFYGGSDLLMELVLPGETVNNEYSIIYDASMPVWAMSIIDNETCLRDAEPMIPFPVWLMYFEDLSGNTSDKTEFRPWDTSGIVIKENTGGSDAGSDSFYVCEITS